MNAVIVRTLPVVIFIAGLAATMAVVIIWRRKLRHRRNPLTTKLLRAPGESLRQQIDDLNLDIYGWLLFTGIIPYFIVSLHLFESYVAGMPETIGRLAVNLMAMAAAMGYGIYKLLGLWRRREHLRLGLDAERATGQELTKLLKLGFHVYHDVPADGFNLDHVAVGPLGVYVIESKGRSKSREKTGGEGVTVYYNGASLQFPSWQETKPIEQVEGAANWLSRQLSRDTGENIRVQPVLSIVGWNVKLVNKKDGPVIYNGGNPDLLFPKWKRQDLSDATIKQICDRIEQWVGDVEPTAYRVE